MEPRNDRPRDAKIFVKGVLFFEEEPDWEILAAAIRRYRSVSRGDFLNFKRCTFEDGEYCLPFYTEGHLQLFKREGRESIDIPEEEAKVDYFKRLREQVEDYFGCRVEFTEMFPDFQHPEDLLEIDEGLSRSVRAFFGPPRQFGADDIRPEIEEKNEIDAYAELDELIGLDSVKEQVRALARLVSEHGKENLPCMHMVFRGNPGTGKTTVARIIAKIFDDAGITSGEGIFVETDRAGLVGQYVGHTADKTERVIKSAQGGTLFIDEAYALAMYDSNRDYGEEAIATLVKALEDKRDDFICIMAGYPNEMNRLIDTNPGLQDRIGFYIDFPDYNSEQLYDVFKLFSSKDDFTVNAPAQKALKAHFATIVANKTENFSNARMVRKIYERIRMDHLLKGSGKKISLASVERVFETEDIKKMVSGKPSGTVIGFC